MDDTETIEWLSMKRQDLLRSYALFGSNVDRWELPRWLKIVQDLEREIRRLKTQLNRGSK
jgi:hypothetical protein